MPRDNVVQHAELNRKTVIQYKPGHAQADEYRDLAKAIEGNDRFVIPAPIGMDALEKLLLDYGMMELDDDYRI